jgi:hypothetical protein
MATAMSGLLYYLLTNQGTIDKLSREVRDTYKSAQDIDIVSALKLSCLHAVIKEALRIFPVVSQGLPRLSSGTVIGGVYVPQGVRRCVSYTSKPQLRRPRPKYTSPHGASPTMSATSTSQIHSAQSAGSKPSARTSNTRANRFHLGPVYVRENGAQYHKPRGSYRLRLEICKLPNVAPTCKDHVYCQPGTLVHTVHCELYLHVTLGHTIPLLVEYINALHSFLNTTTFFSLSDLPLARPSHIQHIHSIWSF